MKMFNVWISRADDAFGVRVDGLENANWLLCRLSDFFVFKTSEPLHEVPNSSDYGFGWRTIHRCPVAGLRSCWPESRK